MEMREELERLRITSMVYILGIETRVESFGYVEITHVSFMTCDSVQQLVAEKNVEHELKFHAEGQTRLERELKNLV